MGDTVSSLLFQPPPPTKLKQHKIIWIDTDNDSRIPGFYIGYNGVDDKARSMTMEEVQMSKPEEGITLLYSHANAEDLGSIYPWCKFLSKMLQVNLFAYDYTGYGMAYDVGTSLIVFNALPSDLFDRSEVSSFRVVRLSLCSLLNVVSFQRHRLTLRGALLC